MGVLRSWQAAAASALPLGLSPTAPCPLSGACAPLCLLAHPAARARLRVALLSVQLRASRVLQILLEMAPWDAS